jgi:hypothetical protein
MSLIERRKYMITKRFKYLKTIFVFQMFYYLKDIILNQCIRLIESLESFSIKRPVKEVKKSLIGLISVLGNNKSVRLLTMEKNLN